MRLVAFFLFSSIGIAICIARPQYLRRLPNSNAHDSPDSGLNCRQLGHTGCRSGAARNQFGIDFVEAGRTWTKELCEKDSDGDGVSNGAELGDPCCVYVEGNGLEQRNTDLSHPGEASDKPSEPANHVCDRSKIPTIVEEKPAAKKVCFPAAATVELDSGDFISMKDLRIGDRVAVGKGQYSPVIMFTHALADYLHEFVQIRTFSGVELSLTEGHFLYVNGKIAAARSVRPGDTLHSGNGHILRVVDVSRRTLRGLYNPQTEHGDIVVNGIRTSTYTEAITNTAAHAALSPFRALYAKLGLATSLLESGIEPAKLKIIY